MTQALLDQRVTNILLAKTIGAFCSGVDGSALQDGYNTTAYIDLGQSSNLDVVAGCLKPITSGGGTGNLISKMQGSPSAGQVASASSAGNNAFGGAPHRAFNYSGSTGWIGLSSSGEWLKIDLGSSKAIGTYVITNKSDGAGSPTAWILEGSNNNTTWTQVDSQSGITWSGGEDKTFTAVGNYRYWKITVSAISSGADTMIAEVAFYASAPSSTAVIISSGVIATSVPTTIFFSGLVKSGVTDISVSRDGGSTWTLATLLHTYGLGQDSLNVVQVSADVSGQPSGQELRYKVATDTEVHGAALWCE